MGGLVFIYIKVLTFSLVFVIIPLFSNVITIEYDETSNDFEGNGRATLTIQGEKAKLDGEFFGDELSHNDDDDDWDDEFDDDDDW